MPDQTPLNPDGVEALAFHLFESEGGERKQWEDVNRKINKRYYRSIARDAAHAYLAAAQPVVNSVEQLKKLPKGTIIKEFPDEHYGNVFRKIGDNEWQETGTPFDYADAGIKLPAIVLYPTEGIN